MQIGIAIEPFPISLEARIGSELSKLWALLAVFPAYDGFGDDHQEAIEAQLSVVAGGLTAVEVMEEFGDECTEAYILNAALVAADWLWRGGKAPSDGWLHINNTLKSTYWLN